MTGYTKLFGSILESTVWMEPPHVKVVWITMLAMCDRDGVVEASVPGLAKRSGVDRAHCEQALSVFLSPDPDSRTQTHEGRRIEAVPGGWRLLNYEVYRHRATKEEATAKAAERKRRQRAREAAASRSVTPVTESHPIADPPAPAPAKSIQTSAVTPIDGDFEAFQNAYPSQRRQGGYMTQTAYVAACLKVAPAALLEAVEQHKRSKQWRIDKVIPSMTKWLQEERWTQVLPEPEATGSSVKTAGNADALRRFAEKRP